MNEREALAVLRGDDPVRAARAAAALWQLWHQSGDAQLDALLLEGIEAMQHQRLPVAGRDFTRQIRRAPEVARGLYNSATVPLMGEGYDHTDPPRREAPARHPQPIRHTPA